MSPDGVGYDGFIFSGFNGRIENIGSVWKFWECPGCGNATGSLPEQCEKCGGISFEWVKIRGQARY